jgi:hypothetical protein
VTRRLKGAAPNPLGAPGALERLRRVGRRALEVAPVESRRRTREERPEGGAHAPYMARPSGPRAARGRLAAALLGAGSLEVWP